MSRIAAVEILQVDLPPPVPRSDAIQAFVTQETPIVRLTMDDGSGGTAYSYTIGTGGSWVVALLKDHLPPRLIGRDPSHIEAIWRDLMFATHATTVGAITSLALAAIDTALLLNLLKMDCHFLNNVEVDLIFSDIQLGDGLSFEIFEKTKNQTPIVFCTAFNQYAIEAFNTIGIDYILKPITKSNEEKALTKFETIKNNLRVLISL